MIREAWIVRLSSAGLLKTLHFVSEVKEPAHASMQLWDNWNVQQTQCGNRPKECQEKNLLNTEEQ